MTTSDATVELIQSETSAVLVHPYNDVYTIAGQGTCTLEFLEQQLALDYVLAPVGGGGLLAGTALPAKTLQPTTKVIGCEPQALPVTGKTLGIIVTGGNVDLDRLPWTR